MSEHEEREGNPRYYFDVENGHGLVRDEEGREFAHLEVARAEALRGVRSLIAEDVLAGRVDLRGRLDVRHGDGSIIFTISFAEAVEILR